MDNKNKTLHNLFGKSEFSSNFMIMSKGLAKHVQEVINDLVNANKHETKTLSNATITTLFVSKKEMQNEMKA